MSAELSAVQQLKAVIVDVYQTEYAMQGAAADRQHLYAIDNSTIAKNEKAGASLVARWEGIRWGRGNRPSQQLLR